MGNCSSVPALGQNAVVAEPVAESVTAKSSDPQTYPKGEAAGLQLPAVRSPAPNLVSSASLRKSGSLRNVVLTQCATRPTNKRTMWHMAAETGQLETLRSLADFVWDTVPDAQGRRGVPAAERTDVHPAIKEAIDSLDEGCSTALMLACVHGHADAAAFLLSMGADPWVHDGIFGKTALHAAAVNNHAACINAVLTHPSIKLTAEGPNGKQIKLVDGPNKAGYTPLHYAAAARCLEAAIALFVHGCDPNAKNKEEGHDWFQMQPGTTALHMCARNGNLDMAVSLLRYFHDHLHDGFMTDPRVVENSLYQKPYQIPGARDNAALAKVLNPDTPLKEIAFMPTRQNNADDREDPRYEARAPTPATVQRVEVKHSDKWQALQAALKERSVHGGQRPAAAPASDGWSNGSSSMDSRMSLPDFPEFGVPGIKNWDGVPLDQRVRRGRNGEILGFPATASSQKTPRTEDSSRPDGDRVGSPRSVMSPSYFGDNGGGTSSARSSATGGGDSFGSSLAAPGGWEIGLQSGVPASGQLVATADNGAGSASSSSSGASSPRTHRYRNKPRNHHHHHHHSSSGGGQQQGAMLTPEQRTSNRRRNTMPGVAEGRVAPAVDFARSGAAGGGDPIVEYSVGGVLFRTQSSKLYSSSKAVVPPVTAAPPRTPYAPAVAVRPRHAGQEPGGTSGYRDARPDTAATYAPPSTAGPLPRTTSQRMPPPPTRRDARTAAQIAAMAATAAGVEYRLPAEERAKMMDAAVARAHAHGVAGAPLSRLPGPPSAWQGDAAHKAAAAPVQHRSSANGADLVVTRPPVPRNPAAAAPSGERRHGGGNAGNTHTIVEEEEEALSVTMRFDSFEDEGPAVRLHAPVSFKRGLNSSGRM